MAQIAEEAPGAARFVRTAQGSRMAFDLFEISVFRLQQVTRFKRLLTGPMTARATALLGPTPAVEHGLIEFRDYAQQSKAFHSRYDMLRYVRKYGLMEPLLRDLTFVLRLYVKACAAGAPGLVDGPLALRSYLERVTFAA